VESRSGPATRLANTGIPSDGDDEWNHVANFRLAIFLWF
jgi:hypothetical protein